MNVASLIEIVRSRYKVLLTVFMLVVVGVIAVTLLLPKKYTATVEIIVDQRSPDPFNGMIMPGGALPGYIFTQIDVIKSERVSRKVISSLGLDKNPTLRQQWVSETDSRGDYMAWVSQALAQNLDVVPSRESSVIVIKYESPEPEFSAAMANAFAKAYVDTVLELRIEPAKMYSALFEEQASVAREKLESAKKKLAEYQAKTGIVATDERFDVENAKLSQLASNLSAMQALAAEAQSKSSRAGPDSVEVQSNPLLMGLKSDLSRQEARYQELSERFGSRHPAVQELQASISELRARIATETRSVARTISQSNQITQARLAQAREDLEVQRRKMLELGKQRSEISLMLADLESAQREYDAIRTRFSQSSLESQANQTNVGILKAASPPSRHSSPHILVNSILSIVLGLLMGLSVIFIQELIDSRVRTASDLGGMEGVDLIAVMPSSSPDKGAGLSSMLGTARVPTVPRISAEFKTALLPDSSLKDKK